MAKKHNHPHCSHDLEFCSHCSVVFCKSCNFEWVEPCTLSHYPYYPYYQPYTNPHNTKTTWSNTAGPTATNAVSVSHKHN